MTVFDRSDLFNPQQVEKVTTLDAEEATPYVGEALRQLRAEVRSCWRPVPLLVPQPLLGCSPL